MKFIKAENSILGPYEKLNLFLPLLFIVLSLVYFVLGHQQTSQESWAWKLVANYIFFNGSHVGLTFLILCYTPEGRSLVKQTWLEKRTIVILSFFVLVYLFLIALTKKGIENSPWILLSFFFIPLVLFHRHSIKQNFGMLMLYNKMRPGEKIESTLSQMRIERFLLRALTFIYVFYLFDRNIFKKIQFLETSIWIGIVTCLAVGILLFIFRLPVVVNKKIYALRLLLFPMSMVSPIAGAGISAAHGFEYSLITARIMKNSKIKQKRFAMFFIFLTLILVTVLQMSYGEDSFLSNLFNPFLPNSSDSLKQAMLAGLFAIDYFHYYLDSLIFKFSSPVVQENLYPLIRGSEFGSATTE